MKKVTTKRIMIVIALVIIISIGIISYYIYCQNNRLHFIETEELSSSLESNLKNDAQEILNKITTISKRYLTEGNITFRYLSGKHNIQEDTNIITYCILYNGKLTSLSLDFETIDTFDITRITFNANSSYATIENKEILKEDYVVDKDTYSNLITCMILCVPESMDEQFLNINPVNFYKELYEKEQINKYGYDISVKGYASDLIIYTFEKVKFTMN